MKILLNQITITPKIQTIIGNTMIISIHRLYRIVCDFNLTNVHYFIQVIHSCSICFSLWTISCIVKVRIQNHITGYILINSSWTCITWLYCFWCRCRFYYWISFWFTRLFYRLTYNIIVWFTRCIGTVWSWCLWSEPEDSY